MILRIQIYSLLFSAKLDALKEYNLMNREILLAACKEIVKEGQYDIYRRL